MSYPIVLSTASREKKFTGGSGLLKRIATSGVTAGATIKLQYRNVESDDWVDHPDVDAAVDQHICGYYNIVAPYNRVFVDGGGGTTSVNLVM